MRGRRVAVAGGGIGGLTAALLLARIGAEVVLLERHPSPTDASTALGLYPNGLAVLHGLGLAEALREMSFQVRRWSSAPYAGWLPPPAPDPTPA